MRIGVKICGVSSEPALSACVDADVDWVGFVFFDRSPRRVTPARAGSLIDRLPSSIIPVGLFVSPTETEIARALDEAPLGALQIYDRPDRIADLGRRFQLPIWHAMPISRRDELPLRTDGARLVVEARAPDSDRPGGNRTLLDLEILSGWIPPVPWFLAGGLTPENVEQALLKSGARAVDVSSGVEDHTGIKDTSAILAFARAARQSRAAFNQ